jgi:hypothetical protein
VDVVAVADEVEHLREQPVRLAVVERHVGRRPQDHHDARAVDPEPRRHRRVRGEVCEVVLLLEARIARQLGVVDAVAPQPLGRDRLRHHHAAGEPAADVVLLRRPFVVESVDGRDPQRGGGERQVVRPVGDREVEALAAERDHPARPARERAQLAGARSAAVRADRVVLDPEAPQDLQRLRVVARGHLHLVSRGPESLDQRPQHERVRGGRYVDPESQADPP